MTIKKVASARSLTFSQWVVKPATKYYCTIQIMKSQVKISEQKEIKKVVNRQTLAKASAPFRKELSLPIIILTYSVLKVNKI